MSDVSKVSTGNKDFITTWLLSLLLGGFGVDRFYLGKIGTGILKLITIGGFGIWWLIDLILVLSGSTLDKSGAKLRGYEDGNNKKIAFFVTIGLVALSIIFGGANASNINTLSSSPADDTLKESSEKPAEKDSVTEKPADTTTSTTQKNTETSAETTTTPPEQTLTAGQKNALGKAESYLSFTAFSRDGLIKQLKFEKFSTSDATYAADHVDVDWNEQAALKAESYLDTTEFSRQGLIDQLKFEGFTTKQATYGVDKVGL